MAHHPFGLILPYLGLFSSFFHAYAVSQYAGTRHTHESLCRVSLLVVDDLHLTLTCNYAAKRHFKSAPTWRDVPSECEIDVCLSYC